MDGQFSLRKAVIAIEHLAILYRSMATRFTRNAFAFVSFAVLVTACRSTILDPSLPGRGVEIVVDSAVYHLQPRGTNLFQVNIAVTVINDGDHDVYLGQYCGYYAVRRADGSATELGAYACAVPGGVALPAPIRIPAGTRYTKTFNLVGTIQPQAGPPITLDDNIGKVKFVYGFTNPLGTEIITIESAPFTVLPPA